MILYQLAKRMEQRNKLQHSLQQSDADIDSILLRKTDVEGELLAQAAIWAQEGQDEFMLHIHTPQSGYSEPESLL